MHHSMLVLAEQTCSQTRYCEKPYKLFQLQTPYSTDLSHVGHPCMRLWQAVQEAA